MGDPKKPKKKYSKPSHPWEKVRIEEEKELIRDFGLKNKKEIWKTNTLLRNFKRQAKKLIPLTGKQADLEKSQLFDRLHNLGLLKKNATLDDVLGLSVRDLLGRRLQTVVYKKGLARSMKQARQFIVHRHITIGEKNIAVPSYLVRTDEEDLIKFVSKSPLAADDHPERVVVKPKKEKPKKKEVKTVKKEEK
ncbi:30S ribosomal protein S4 [Candidatus Woesearchaeota archaeon]|nr:MAG: 30S ribosomal protein S4 [Candidatus Woesearchaeota archaeon]